jgi:hypothetical protein
MDSIAKDALMELKGYVDACVDAYQDNNDGIPYTVLENIQKRIATIVQIESDAGRS